MVYKLNGDPTNSRETCERAAEMNGTSPALCVRFPSDAQLSERVFCTCRCGTTGGADDGTPLCECGEGFVCSDDESLGTAAGPVLSQGGVGIRGSYCLRVGTI